MHMHIHMHIHIHIHLHLHICTVDIHTAYDFELNLYRDGLVHALRYPKSPVEHRVENISHIRWIDPMKTESSTGPEINSSKLSRYTTERPQLLPLQ